MDIVTGKDSAVLRQKAQPITEFTPELAQLVKEMFVMMKKADGIGLAAPQIGKSMQLFVVDPLAFDRERSKWEFKKLEGVEVDKGLALVNPSIATYPKGSDEMVEGCLSLPGWEGSLTRAKRITIKAQTLDGQTFKLQAKGLLARVLQHEYDHLQGTLICDKWKDPREVSDRKLAKVRERYTDIVFFGDSAYSAIVYKKLTVARLRKLIPVGKEGLASLKEPSYSLGLVASYGKKIPEAVINKFKYGILNIHPSLLPRYRGPTPLQAALLNGDRKTGVTIMKINEAIDAGPIVAQEEFEIDQRYTSKDLGEILFERGADLFLDILPLYLRGKIQLRPQDASQATMTKLIRKEDGLIDWRSDAVSIERAIRAYQPWPLAYTFFDHRGKHLRVQILESQVMDPLQSFSDHGTLERRKNELVVRCSQGLLRILKLRPEGKKEMSGEEFLRGYEPTICTRHSS